MRVISGSAKGLRLLSVPGDQTRPITDRVKEALFDIVGGDVVGSTWWDVYAGTGAVGIEALSRGAAYARFTEMQGAALKTIRSNLASTRLADRADVRQANADALLASPPDRHFDYVYLAPPQYKGIWAQACAALDANARWLSGDGWIVAQIHPKEYRSLQLNRLEEFDSRRYGTTLLVFFEGRLPRDEERPP
ncbi:MAG: 16S rRNA (guanine(966)-N(2))-methyltransferase RsmD [Anaerolineales bacterium]